MTSLPEPLSPVISTVAAERATRSTVSSSRRMGSLAMIAVIPKNTQFLTSDSSSSTVYIYHRWGLREKPSVKHPRRPYNLPPRHGPVCLNTPEPIVPMCPHCPYFLALRHSPHR